MSTCSYELALKGLKLSKQLQIGLVAISKGSVVAWLVSLILNFFFLGGVLFIAFIHSMYEWHRYFYIVHLAINKIYKKKSFKKKFKKK